MSTIRDVLRSAGWLRSIGPDPDPRTRAEALAALDASGLSAPLLVRLALEALAAGGRLDDSAPVDPADPVAMLCRTLDTCDEGDVAHVLALLADALEEASDPRAAGLRRAAWFCRSPESANGGALWGWCRKRRNRAYLPHHLARRWFDRLPPQGAPGRTGTPAMWYPSRSVAFLALAEALTHA
jgi:hypothetical protein